VENFIGIPDETKLSEILSKKFSITQELLFQNLTAFPITPVIGNSHQNFLGILKTPDLSILTEFLIT